RRALQGVDSVAEFWLERAPAFKETFIAIEIESRQSRSRCKRMAGVGIAVEEIDGVGRLGLEGLIERVLDDDAAHRHGAVGDALGEGDHVRDNAIALSGKGIAEAAEAGDHLVEDEKNAVAVTERTQAGQIILGRRKN